MSVVVRNRTGWVLDPCAPAERRGGGQDREDQDQEDQNQGDRQNQEVPNQELKGRFRRRCFLASNRPHVVTTDTSSLTPSRKRKRKHVNLNQGEIDAQAYHGQVRAFIVEGTRCLLEAARLLGYLEAGSREDGSRQAGSREAGSREAGSREAVSREAGSREAGSREAGEGEEPPPCPDCNLAALCDMAKQLPLAEEQEEVPVQSLPAGGVCSTSDLDLFSRITENNADSAVEATLLGAHYIIPPHTGFLLSDFTRIQPLVRYGKKFDLIVLDPPWENKSVKRSGRYSILPSSQLKRLPVPLLAAPGCLVVTWVTNKPRLLRFVRDQLYPHWGVRVVAEWLWVKVTTSGEYVFPLDSPHKKPYEVLLLGRYAPPPPPSPPHPPPPSPPHPPPPSHPDPPPPSPPHPPSPSPPHPPSPSPPHPPSPSHSDPPPPSPPHPPSPSPPHPPSPSHPDPPPPSHPDPPPSDPEPCSDPRSPDPHRSRSQQQTEEVPVDERRLIVSVPSVFHSQKPSLSEVLRPYVGPRCLEMFARGLQPGWTSWGNEVLKFQHSAYYRTA